MKKKVKEVIEELSQDELLKLRFDLKHHSKHILRLIDKRLRFLETRGEHVCATCGKTINLEEDNAITLTFGPPDFKRRAYFCGIDCLEYFISELKRIEKKKLQQPVYYVRDDINEDNE